MTNQHPIHLPLVDLFRVHHEARTELMREFLRFALNTAGGDPDGLRRFAAARDVLQRTQLDRKSFRFQEYMGLMPGTTGYFKREEAGYPMEPNRFFFDSECRVADIEQEIRAAAAEVRDTTAYPFSVLIDTSWPLTPAGQVARRSDPVERIPREDFEKIADGTQLPVPDCQAFDRYLDVVVAAGALHAQGLTVEGPNPSGGLIPKDVFEIPDFVLRSPDGNLHDSSARFADLGLLEQLLLATGYDQLSEGVAAFHEARFYRDYLNTRSATVRRDPEVAAGIGRGVA